MRDGDSFQSRRALERLCSDYWFPLYAFARRTGKTDHDAEDAVQGFFTHALRKTLFSHADRERGKLRTLLLTSFTHWMASEHQHQMAGIRGGNAEHISLDTGEAESRYQKEMLIHHLTPDLVYTRQWAELLLDRCTRRLRAQYACGGNGEYFDRLLPFLDDPNDTAERQAAYQAMGMTSSAFRTALSRLRRDFREVLIEEVRNTLDTDDPKEIQAELRELFAALSR